MDKKNVEKVENKLEKLVITPDIETETLFVCTKRSKTHLNVAIEDFSRTHGHFSERNNPLCIETIPITLAENEKIKFLLRLVPGKHVMHLDAIYTGTEKSATILIDAHLLDKNGHKVPFENSRKVEIQIGSRFTECLNKYIYDRDELERKRGKLFNGDTLVLAFEIIFSWCQVSDKPNEDEQ
jgi:hypothetical protein